MKKKVDIGSRKPNRLRLVFVGASLSAILVLSIVIASFIRIDTYADAGIRKGLSLPSPAHDASKADLILRFLTPGAPPSAVIQSWEDSDRTKALLAPDRVYRMSDSSRTLALAANPLGILYNSRVLREAGADPPTTWDGLWSFPRKKPVSARSPIGMAGGDPVAFTQVLIVLAEALSDAKSAREGLSRLWEDPLSGITKEGLLSKDNPLRAAVDWLMSAQSRGDLYPGWLRSDMGDIWLAIRDGHCRAAIVPYGLKRQYSESENFSLEWLPFPPRTGRMNYSVGAVLLAAEIPRSAWNANGARHVAAGFLEKDRQISLAKSLGFVPLAAGLPPFDIETRDARIGLSVAPVFALPASEAALPAGWGDVLDAVRKELGN